MTQTQQNARLVYNLGVQHGLSPARARELVAAAYEESGLNAGINNRQGSGAAGLFQLLSSGYVSRAKKLGGVYNPKANTLAILPAYVRYWQQHPNARPGEGAAAVEASGQGAGFYARHLGRFAQVGGGDAGPVPRPSPLPGLATAPGNTQQVGQALLAAVQAGPQHNDFSQLYALLQQHAQTRAQDEASHIHNAVNPATPNVLGKVTLAMGADRAGVHTSPAVLQFVRKIAGLARTTLTIGTGSNHSHMTVNGNVSDHWSGHAADIPASGANLIHLGRLALIAAGADPKWAMKQKGGLYNVGGHQVIFNTHKGGDHTNHLHVSAH